MLNLNAVASEKGLGFYENQDERDDDASLGNPNAPGLNSRNVNGYGTGGLGLCEGDCDTDSDCASGLSCFQRSGYTTVPGCTGSGIKNWDYCYKIPSVGLCEGDCDTDSDWASGLKSVLLATVSMTACLVFVAARRLFARFDGSKVGNENRESEEKATLFGGKQPRHSTREFAYGSVI